MVDHKMFRAVSIQGIGVRAFGVHDRVSAFGWDPVGLLGF